MMIFSNEGSYELLSEVTIKEVSKSSTTQIDVDKKVIPHVQLKYFPVQPISVTKSNEIVVTILNLIPKCFTYWNILTDDGFSDFKEDAEGNFTDMGFTFIKDFEEYFLQELVDYDNNTLSKDITLNIPPDVLTPNVKYKFRLTVTCPEPITESKSQAQRQNVTSFYDVIMSTNGPPDTLPLLVQPANGVAMKQKFKFATGAAKDSPTDFPLKYSFSYVVDNITVVIGTFYENSVAHTQLPFADAIETFFEVCDNSGACTKASGPVVAANITQSYTAEEIDFKIEEFDAMLRRAEYSKAMNSGLVFLITQKKISDDISSYEERMLKMMKKELEKLKSSETESFFYQQNIIEFVKMSKNVMVVMSIADEQFVDELLTLTDTISRTAKRMKRAIVARNFIAKVINHDIDYFKNVLTLSEMLLMSSNATVVQQEKGKFVQKIHKFSASLCQDKKLNSHVIETKFAIVEVSKVYFPQLSIDPQWMPGGDGSSILFAFTSNFPSKYVCVEKVKYAVDMFTPDSNVSKSSVYETTILDADSSGTFRSFPVSDLTESVTVEILASPINSTCVIWKDNSWSSDDCIKQKSSAADRVVSKCKINKSESIIVK